MRESFTKEDLETAISKSTSLRELVNYFDYRPSGYIYRYFRELIKLYGLSIDHYTDKSKGIHTNQHNKKSDDEYLTLSTNLFNRVNGSKLKKILLRKGIPYKCDICSNNGTWRDKTLGLEVDHKNSNWRDNRIENLRFLCPNCHKQETDKNRSTSDKICKCGNKKCKTTKLCICCSNKINGLKQRKIARPSKDELLDLVLNNNFEEVGRKFGVNSNSIRKWCKAEEIDWRKITHDKRKIKK